MDMGLLLEMIYECGKGQGTLTFVYPGDFSVDECRAMVDHMHRRRTAKDSSIIDGDSAGVSIRV